MSGRLGSKAEHMGRNPDRPARLRWQGESAHDAAQEPQNHTGKAIALIVASAALAAAILVAWNNPANGYELSLYSATPLLFWAGIAVAVVIAASVASAAVGDRVGQIAVLQIGLAVAAVVALPLIRNYHYYGKHDGLFHLGYARSIAFGPSSLFDLIYPGSHGFAIAVGRLTGYDLPKSMLLVAFLFVAVFLVFLPLSVRTLFNDSRLTAIAAVSGAFILPANNVSTVVSFHSFSLAMFFSTVILFFLFKHLQHDAEDTSLPASPSMSGVMLLLTTGALNFFHPQLTVDVLAVFGAITLVQFVFRRFRPDHPLGQTRLIYLHLFALMAVFVLWNTHHWKFFYAIEGTTEAFINTIQGTAEAGSDATSRTASANQIGTNIVALFVKLFGVSFVYVVLSAGLLFIHVVGRSSPDKNTENGIVVTYFTVGGLAMAPFALLQFLGAISNHFFRHLGFAMVLMTIMGTVALARIPEFLPFGDPRRFGPTLRRIGVLAAVVCLVLSVLVVYPSPYMYKPSSHVSEQRMQGFTYAFANQPDDASIWFGGIGAGPIREKVGLFNDPSAPWDTVVKPIPHLSGVIPPKQMDNLTAYYEKRPEQVTRRDHYVPVTDYTTGRALGAYDELHYSRENFTAMDRQPRVYRIQSNGDLTLYYVNTACDPVCNPDGAIASSNTSSTP